jgi:transglutaminase-like putative cysteine protease
MKKLFLSVIVLATVISLCGCKPKMVLNADGTAKIDNSVLDDLIENGKFAKAKKIIAKELAMSNLSDSTKMAINFETEKMNRIALEFNQTDSTVLTYIKKYIPDVTDKQIREWKKSGALECKVIDGKTFYFKKAARNLFRIDTVAKKAFEKVEGPEQSLDKFLGRYLSGVVSAAKKPMPVTNPQTASYVEPVTMTLHFSMEVDPDAVPAGETVRVWLPYPRVTPKYNSVKLLSVSQPDYKQSPVSNMRSCLYMEKVSNGKDTLKFGYDITLTSYNQYFTFDPRDIKPYDVNSNFYKFYTSQRKHHVIFTDDIKALTASIVGKETNPYQKVLKIWSWINKHTVWAGARDYSTIPNIPEYVLANKHGDCGEVSLLFITMARCAGVPARWQSGWMLHPGDINLHDWAQVYYEGIGWVPVDQSFGFVTSNNPDVHNFYSKGLDAFRYIVNDDYGDRAPLYPAKIYPHSDEVDFQMGEVEWKGGNVYYTKWGSSMKVDYISPAFNPADTYK